MEADPRQATRNRAPSAMSRVQPEDAESPGRGRQHQRLADAVTKATTGETLLLTSVTVVCRANPQVDALKEVKHQINGFMDVSSSWTILRACEFNVSGLLRLLRRVVMLQDRGIDRGIDRDIGRGIDRVYKLWIFEEAIKFTVKHGNVPVIKWLVEEYAPSSKIRDGIEAAAKFGRVDLLEWVRSVHNARAVWEPKDLDVAAANNRFEVVKWLHENVAAANSAVSNRFFGWQ